MKLDLGPIDTEGLEQAGNLLKCVLNGNKAVYISVSITSGKRKFEWYSSRRGRIQEWSESYKRMHHKHVVVHNLSIAKKKISRLRKKFGGRYVIDPTLLDRPQWSQNDYRFFWGRVIERYVDTVVFLKDWEYSDGCTYEFLATMRSKIRAYDEQLRKLDCRTGLKKLEDSIAEIKQKKLEVPVLEMVADELRAELNSGIQRARILEPKSAIEKFLRTRESGFKDAILDQLAFFANIAQFISFAPTEKLDQRFCRINGVEPNFRFSTAEDAISALLKQSPDQTVNLRSFVAGKTKGLPLKYGLNSVDEILALLRQNAREGKHTIVNETVDVDDGGVSGVALGNTIEFAPRDTPKCVDKPGVCSLPRDLGVAILQTVYGFQPELAFKPELRVEFSIHPRRRGLRKGHTIIWELEHVGRTEVNREIVWPNKFSQMLGDKVFGLLLADGLQLLVPKSTIINRFVAPFQFGRRTGSEEFWLRTAPAVRAPGQYSTTYGWNDPFEIISAEDKGRVFDGSKLPAIPSVIAQESVEFQYSGSLIASESHNPIIEGVQGQGDSFMVGKIGPQPLPKTVVHAVSGLYKAARKRMGPVDFEWVFDGRKAWIVQIHMARQTFDTLTSNHNEGFTRFDVSKGLDSLRKLIAENASEVKRVILVGDVGLTSHFGDVLRKSMIPFIIERPS